MVLQILTNVCFLLLLPLSNHDTFESPIFLFVLRSVQMIVLYTQRKTITKINRINPAMANIHCFYVSISKIIYNLPLTLQIKYIFAFND